jgi:hypothetical protein
MSLLAMKVAKARAPRKPSYLSFDKDSYPWKSDIDYRAEPQKYRVGKGEQGVLICEPYKSEIVKHWHFRTPEIATESSREIFKLFKAYLKNDEFVGADMARKFLQMGFTRARRYANYRGGRKYDKENDYALNEKGTGDPEKAESADIFFKAWKKAEEFAAYKQQKEEWKKMLG